jgi:stage IV sporulation protein B
VFFSQIKEIPLIISDSAPMKLKMFRVLLALLICCAAILGTADFCIDDSYSYRSDSFLPAGGILQLDANEAYVAADTRENVSYCASLFGVIPIKQVTVRKFDNIRLCPGGMPFGAKLFTDGLIVVGFSDVDCTGGSPHPASDAGIQVKDIIVKINGTPVGTTENMSRLVSASEGRPITVTVRRNDTEFNVSVTPSWSNSDQVYKTGMWVRDNTAGIGTVTYVDPKSGAFAGLGHGICDAETGSLMPLSRGIVIDVTISGIQKGQSGAPGELKGHFSSGKIGTLLGRGLTFDQAMEELKGVTLESIVIATRTARAVRKLAARGVVSLDDYPLLMHVDEIINQGAEVNIPWEKFTMFVEK